MVCGEGMGTGCSWYSVVVLGTIWLQVLTRDETPAPHDLKPSFGPHGHPHRYAQTTIDINKNKIHILLVLEQYTVENTQASLMSN